MNGLPLECRRCDALNHPYRSACAFCAAPLRGPGDGVIECPDCGEVTDADHRYCPSCGSTLKQSLYDEVEDVTQPVAGAVGSAGRHPLIGAADVVSRAAFLDSGLMRVSEPDEDDSSITHWGAAVTRATKALKLAHERVEELESQAREAEAVIPASIDPADNPSAHLRGAFNHRRIAEAELLEAKDDEAAAQARVDALLHQAAKEDAWFALSGNGPPVPQGQW